MSETVTLPFPAKPRNRSIEARRAARVEKAVRERRIVDSLNRGVSAAEIAAREGVTEKRMRAVVREILARRMPEAPADYVALQLGRLNEALLVAYSAMSGANLRAVECVVRIVREMDRYHGFVAAGRRAARNGRAMETGAPTDGSPPALQATEESRRRAPIDALSGRRLAHFGAARPGRSARRAAGRASGASPAAGRMDRGFAWAERGGSDGCDGPGPVRGRDASLRAARRSGRNHRQRQRAASRPRTARRTCPGARRADGADALQGDRPQMAPETFEKTENTPGETPALEAAKPDSNPAWTRRGEPGEANPDSRGDTAGAPAEGAAARPQTAPQDPEGIESAPGNDARPGSADDGTVGAAAGLAPCGEAPRQDAPGPELADRSRNAPEPFEIAPAFTVRVPSETPGVFRLVKLRMTRNGIMACA